MKFLMLAILLGALGIGCAQGQTEPSCSYTVLHEAKLESKFAFAQASLIALSYAQGAVQEAAAFTAEQTSETDAQATLIGMMRHTKLASEQFACAERVLAQYRQSPDRKMIGFTADFLALLYKQHRFLNDTFLELLRKLPDLSSQPAKLADTISTIEVERGKLWNDLIKGTTLTLLGLLDQNRTDDEGTLHILVITRCERKELLDRLVQSFPEVKDKEKRTAEAGPAQAAGLYYLFLTKPYNCADE
jgi:hypothetical protein